MIIPTGVSHFEFWEKIKKTKIKISSRFPGVYFKVSKSGSPSWLAKAQSKRKHVWSKKFPFTEQGESDASEHYQMKLRRKN